MARKRGGEAAEGPPPPVGASTLPAGMPAVGVGGLDMVTLLAAAGSCFARPLATQGVRSKWFHSTGCAQLDRLMGDGINHGLGSGRLYLLWGLEQTGKSLICLYAAKSMIAQGGVALYVDIERTLGADVVARLGIDPERLFLLPTTELLEKLTKKGSGEQRDRGKVREESEHGFTLEVAFAEVERFVRNVRRSLPNVPILVVYDSIAASITETMGEADYGDSRPGHLARALGEAFPKFRSMLADLDATCIMVNHQKQKIGLVFGDPRTQPGGGAVKFHPDSIVNLAKQAILKDGKVEVGEEIRATVTKSRLQPGHASTVFRINYATGIDDYYGVASLAVEFGLVQVAGAWYSTPAGKFQGIEQFADGLRAAPDVFRMLRKEVLDWKPTLSGVVQAAPVPGVPGMPGP